MADALFLCIGTKHTGSNLNFDAILFLQKVALCLRVWNGAFKSSWRNVIKKPTLLQFFSSFSNGPGDEMQWNFLFDS